MTAQACPDCGGEMEEGFIPEISFAGTDRSLWHRGKPQSIRFLGLKTGVKFDKTEVMPIRAYRCNKCGVLRFYAHEQDQ